jgi:serine/threonine-protein kinase
VKIRAKLTNKHWQTVAALLDARVLLLLFVFFFLLLGAKTTATGLPAFSGIDKTLFRIGARLQGRMGDVSNAFVRIDVPRADMQSFLHDPASAVNMMSFLTRLQASSMKGSALVLHDVLWNQYGFNDLTEHTQNSDFATASASFRAMADRMSTYRSLLANERVIRTKVIDDYAVRAKILMASKALPVLSAEQTQFVGITAPQAQHGALGRPLLWRGENAVRYDARLALFSLQQNVRSPEWLPAQGIKMQGIVIPASPASEVLPFFSVDNGFSVPAAIRYPLSAVLDQSALRVLQNKIVVIGEEGDLDADDLLLSVASLENASFATPFRSYLLLHLCVALSIALYLFALPLLSVRWGALLSVLMAVALVLAQQIVFSVHREWFPISQWLIFLLSGHALVFLWCVKRSFEGERIIITSTEKQAAHSASTLVPTSMSRTVKSKSSFLEKLQRKKQIPQRIQPSMEGSAAMLDFEDSTIIATARDRQRTDSIAPLRGTSSRQHLGRYQILRELGRGAMGVVYLGFDPTISRQVAIKTLHYDQFDASELPNIKERFFREAAAVGQLRHPNIVTIYDAGEEPGLAYIAMDFVDGVALSEHTRKDSLLSVELVYYIMAMAADAVYHAHKQNIIHRDIKPSNILYDEKTNEVKVADFGIARIMDGSATRTRTGDLLGSPLYMSPEQIRGEQVGHYTDIFSLGVTFYQLLTGELPFKADNIANLTFQIVQCKFKPVDEVRPDLPASAKRIINKALQKNPANRYESASDMQLALHEAYKRDFS